MCVSHRSKDRSQCPSLSLLQNRSASTHSTLTPFFPMPADAAHDACSSSSTAATAEATVAFIFSSAIDVNRKMKALYCYDDGSEAT